MPAKSIQRYSTALTQLLESLQLTESTSSSESFERLFRESKRVFFVGKGTSSPACIWGVQQLLSKGKDAYFISSPRQLEVALSAQDSVCLVSHSWATQDAIKVSRVVKHLGSRLGVITANPAPDHGLTADAVFQIFPTVEKIFSRPASVITSFYAMMKILANENQVPADINEVMRAVYSSKQTEKQGLKALLDQRKTVVIVHDVEQEPVAYAYALGISEGCGIPASYFNFDTYIHGWWVPHLRSPEQYGFVVFDNPDRESNYMANIQSFFSDTNTPYVLLDSDGFIGPYNMIYQMGRLVHTTHDYLLETGYDLNNPPGKEAIRKIY